MAPNEWFALFPSSAKTSLKVYFIVLYVVAQVLLVMFGLGGGSRDGGRDGGNYIVSVGLLLVVVLRLWRSIL